MDGILDRIESAIEGAQIGYSIALSSLVDDEVTYTLAYADGAGPYEFGSHSEAMAHVSARRGTDRAKAILAAMREPDRRMLAAGSRAGDSLAVWHAMIDAALAESGVRGTRDLAA